MNDRPVIPQDLAQRGIDALRLRLRHEPGCTVPQLEDCSCGFRLGADVIRELNALEQAPDPAEVGARKWFHCEVRKCVGDTTDTPSHIAWHCRQAHAEQRDAVKELSDHARLFHGCCTTLNTRVRHLFGFDKEKP